MNCDEFMHVFMHEFIMTYDLLMKFMSNSLSQ